MLGFIVSAADGGYVNVDNIHHIELLSSTAIDVHFKGDDGGAGSAELTCNTDKADEVAKELARLVVQGQGVITVADSLNSHFAIADVTAVANYNKSE
tara:strand:- start:160 stop:450 length:291 start_codon:yes stop_codon:yes gene_type:complete